MMTLENAHAVQWNRLPDIGDVQALNSDDVACLEEISKVLDKHGRSSKFGIALLHKHFDLDQDEILVETVNLPMRTLTATPIKRSEMAGGGYTDTVWKFDVGRIAIRACPSYHITRE